MGFRFLVALRVDCSLASQPKTKRGNISSILKVPGLDIFTLKPFKDAIELAQCYTETYHRNSFFFSKPP